MKLTRLTTCAAAVILAGLAVSCNRPAPQPLPIAEEIPVYVPADATALAGFDLTQLRASPLYSQLPVLVASLTAGVKDANKLYLAWNGSEALGIARGPYPPAPPGATLAAPGLALFGTDERIRAAVAQSKQPITNDLLRRLGEPLAAANAAWVVARGPIVLPVTGNAANLNRVLQSATSATLSLKLSSDVTLEATATSADERATLNMEEKLRAFITLAMLGEKRHPEQAAALQSIHLHRDGMTVRLSLTASPEVVTRLIEGLLHP